MQAAGFDGLEIHAGHGYLIAEFLSAYSNHRADIYGGPLVNRLRFLLNIVDGIKARVGDDFPLVVRISAREFVANGVDVPEAIEIGKALAAKGVDALSVSVGVYESFNRLSMVSGEPEGQWLDIAGQVRAGIPIPVIGVGRLVRASVAEDALAAGRIDLAAYGRASVADPDLPAKIRAGREAEIMVCMGCNQCLGRSARPQAICPVNPAIGREGTFEFAKVATPRRVAIVGGGFAALTAAWITAQRGHAVTCFANGAGHGGLMDHRAKVPGQEVIGEATAALIARAKGAGVIFAPGQPAGGDHDTVWVVRRFQSTMTSPFGAAVSPGGMPEKSDSDPESFRRDDDS